MTTWLAIVLVAAAGAGPATEALERGRAARSEGVPQAAIHGLRTALVQSSGAEARALVAELARCLLASDRESEALDWTSRPEWKDAPEVTFWRAQAFAQKGDYARALADYRRAAAADDSLRDDARYGAARMLEALGRTADALDAYLKIAPESRWRVPAQLAGAAILLREEDLGAAKELLESIRPESPAAADLHRYLLARLALAQNDLDGAARWYAAMTAPPPLLAAGRAVGLAELRARRGEVEEAEADLEAFVTGQPRGAGLREVLAKIDELRARQKDPSNARLRVWEKDEQHRDLAAAASYYLARGDERQGRLERAMRNYADFLNRYPQDPLAPAAAVRLADLELRAGNVEAAAAVLGRVSEDHDRAGAARLAFVRGATDYRRARFDEARTSFVAAANANETLAIPALQNAALAAIAAGDASMAAEILSALRKESAPTAREIQLARAKLAAGRGNSDADDQLTRLAEAPSEVADRARLALAEYRWAEGDLPGARREFRRIANSARGDQADYFAVFLADDGSAGASERVGAAARAFLAGNPGSPHESEVRMKWGEVLARSGDLRAARVQFEQAARGAADANARASALFLAAKAAGASMDPPELEAAIALLEEVAGEKSAGLAESARWEQARLQSALGRPEESIRILDNLLGLTKDPRLTIAVRLRRGDALRELSRAQPDRFEEACREWRAVADDRDALPAERNEALVRLGSAAEQAGDTDRALAAYYEALNAPRDKDPEFFWFYKAGFEAAQLLLDHDRLTEAAAIYEKMASAPGPRAQEARERVKRLRLENFIWED